MKRQKLMAFMLGLCLIIGVTMGPWGTGTAQGAEFDNDYNGEVEALFPDLDWHEDTPELHIFSEDWSKNENGHWYDMICGHSSEYIPEVLPHEYNTEYIRNDGLDAMICNVCGYITENVYENEEYDAIYLVDELEDEEETSVDKLEETAPPILNMPSFHSVTPTYTVNEINDSESPSYPDTDLNQQVGNQNAGNESVTSKVTNPTPLEFQAAKILADYINLNGTLQKNSTYDGSSTLYKIEYSPSTRNLIFTSDSNTDGTLTSARMKLNIDTLEIIGNIEIVLNETTTGFGDVKLFPIGFVPDLYNKNSSYQWNVTGNQYLVNSGTQQIINLASGTLNLSMAGWNLMIDEVDFSKVSGDRSHFNIANLGFRSFITPVNGGNNSNPNPQQTQSATARVTNPSQVEFRAAKILADFIALRGPIEGSVTSSTSHGVSGISYSPITNNLTLTYESYERSTGQINGSTVMNLNINSLEIIGNIEITDYQYYGGYTFQVTLHPENFVPDTYTNNTGYRWSMSGSAAMMGTESAKQTLVELAQLFLQVSMASWNAIIKKENFSAISNDVPSMNIANLGFRLYDTAIPIGGDDSHTHTFSVNWSVNESYHWHAATCEHNVTTDYLPHSFGNWVVSIPATSTTSGVQERYCQVCNYKETGSIPPIGNMDTGSEIINRINSASDGSWITISINSFDNIPATVFDSLRGTSKTLEIVLPNGVTWIINGEDVIGDSKDIKVATEISLPSDAGHIGQLIFNLVNGIETIVIRFPDNGNLPGMIKVRIPFNEDMISRLGASGVAAYYVNKSSESLELIASNLSLNGTYIEMPIWHNSTYILTRGLVGSTSNHNPENSLNTRPTNIAVSTNTVVTSPKTGDSSEYYLWLTMMIVGMMLFGITLIIYNRGSIKTSPVRKKQIEISSVIDAVRFLEEYFN